MRKCSWIKPKKSTPLLPFLSLEGSFSPPPLFTFRPWWIEQTSYSVVIDSVNCQKVFQKWERRDLQSEAISKLGSIKALLFQTLFSTQLILEWKVPQIQSLQTIWNTERKILPFFFSLFHDVGASCFFLLTRREASIVGKVWVQYRSLLLRVCCEWVVLCLKQSRP